MMICPNCHDVSDTVAFKCSACGAVYERDALANIQHLEFVQQWLSEHAPLLGASLNARLLNEVQQQRDELRRKLRLDAPNLSSEHIAARSRERALIHAMLARIDTWASQSMLPTVNANALRRYAQARLRELDMQIAPYAPATPTISDAELKQFALDSLPLLAQAAPLTPHGVKSLHDYFDPPPAPVARATVLPPAPIQRTAPSQPPLDWSKVWQRGWNFVVSGALLRGLLYLGAFMIVVSAAVLVIVYWRAFHPLLQLSFIAAVPIAFYLGGFILRARLQSPIAGSVFTSIASLLVAVDFAAVYQLGGFAGNVDATAYWFVASLVCTAIYTLTAWRVRAEFYGYITLLALANVLVAFTRVLHLPLEWSIAAVSALAAAMLASAAATRHVPDAWSELTRTLRRLPRILMPLSQAAVLFVPGSAAPGQLATFALAALGYGISAWYFPSPILAQAAVWSSMAAAFFALQFVALPWEWYASAASVLALAYLSGARWIARRLPENFPPRIAFTTAQYLAGFMLLSLAAVAALATLPFNLWAAVLALVLITVVLAWCAYVFRQSVFALLASGFFIMPFTLALARWLLDAQVADWGAWLMSAWTALSLSYLGIAVLLRRAERYARWLNAWAHALAPLACAGLLLNYASPARWRAGPSLVALSGVLLVYIVSAVIHDRAHDPALSNWVKRLPAPVARAIFLWPIAWLLLVWLFVGWIVAGFDAQWLPTGYVALALLSMVAGEWLRRRQLEYRTPCQTGALVAWAFGLALTLDGTLAAFAGRRLEQLPALLVAQTSAAVLTMIAARVYRTRWPLYVEPWLALLPATLFFMAYGTQIFGRGLSAPHYALVWLALGTLHLLAAAWLDRSPVRYTHGLYLGGYGLTVLALFWSIPDRVTNLYTLGALIIIALLSQVMVHTGRHRSFGEFIQLVLGEADSLIQRAGRTLFLCIAAYAWPIWLFELLAHLDVPLAWRGLALALNAPAYIALGLLARRTRRGYAWPLYSAGYALTAIGALLTLGDERLLIAALTLDAVVFAASAYLFRRAHWLYLSNVLAPIVVWLVLHANGWLSALSLALSLTAIVFVYFALGRWFERIRTDGKRIAPFALPFYALAYPLSALPLVIANADKYLALEIYAANVVLYALSAWAFRQTIFLYPALGLATVPYAIALTFTALPPAWYGLSWLPLIVLSIALGKFVFERQPMAFRASRPETYAAFITHPALPFYLLAYTLSVYMLVLSSSSALTFSLASIAAAVLYFATAALFRRASWLYPALLAVHLALLASLSTAPATLPPRYLSLPFLALTWLIALSGYAFNRAVPLVPEPFKGSRLLQSLLTPSWGQPFFIVSALDVLLWEVVALGGVETALIVSVGHGLLLALFAVLWQDRILAYGTLIFFLGAVDRRLAQAGVSNADAFGWFGAIGLVLYSAAKLIEQLTRASRHIALNVWPRPLNNSAIVLSTLMIFFALPGGVAHSTALMATLAFAGALYLALAYEQRNVRLSYVGLALLELAWVLALVTQNVRQPQGYAIPAGLYFVAIGWLERRRGSQMQIAMLVESFGMAVMLLTSFIQSLGAASFPYFLLLLIEALIVIWWGATWRLKIPFFIGLAASVLNVLAQVVVIVNVYDINRFLVIFGAGIMLVTLAVFVERQRVRIIAKAQEWLVVLEAWQ